MDEKKEENKPTDVNNAAGNIAETAGLVERAEQASKRLEEQEKRVNERIAYLETLEAKRVLGGKTVLTQVAEPKELTPAEYAKEVAAGRVPKK